jgi:hypothetical protein
MSGLKFVSDYRWATNTILLNAIFKQLSARVAAHLKQFCVDFQIQSGFGFSEVHLV